MKPAGDQRSKKTRLVSFYVEERDDLSKPACVQKALYGIHHVYFSRS